MNRLVSYGFVLMIEKLLVKAVERKLRAKKMYFF